MKRLLIAALLSAGLATPAAASIDDHPLQVGQSITFSNRGHFDYFGCRNIENTKHTFFLWFGMNGSELGRQLVERFVRQHELDPARADRASTINDECQSFSPGESRYVEKAVVWKNGKTTEQLVCLRGPDFDSRSPEQIASDPKPYVRSACLWMIPTIDPMISRPVSR